MNAEPVTVKPWLALILLVAVLWATSLVFAYALGRDREAALAISGFHRAEETLASLELCVGTIERAYSATVAWDGDLRTILEALDR